MSRAQRVPQRRRVLRLGRRGPCCPTITWSATEPTAMSAYLEMHGFVDLIVVWCRSAEENVVMAWSCAAGGKRAPGDPGRTPRSDPLTAMMTADKIASRNKLHLFRLPTLLSAVLQSWPYWPKICWSCLLSILQRAQHVTLCSP